MSVTDPVDRYRHGVLIGNYVEDKFGTDLLQQNRQMDPKKLATTKDYHDINHSLYKPHPIISQKDPSHPNFYQTSRYYEQNQYKKPQGETSYDIFHRQEVTQKVPILKNDAKREENMHKEGRLYDNSRYYLSNKFGSAKQVKEIEGQNQYNMKMLRETGNMGNVEEQEIPDILTGQIWKAGHKKPDADAKNKTKNSDEPTTKIGVSVGAKSINPYGATSLIKPEIAKFDQDMYKRYVLPNDKGEERDVLFGHGIALDEFHRRQMTTTYDLSFNQQIQPQTQVNSFFNPDPSQTSKKFHRETVEEKTYQQKIPEYGTKTILGQEKVGRPYDPYTKTFDLNHLKHEYLRK